MNCFGCNGEIGKGGYLVRAGDNDTVFVGYRCFREIRDAGENGLTLHGVTLRALDGPLIETA